MESEINRVLELLDKASANWEVDTYKPDDKYTWLFGFHKGNRIPVTGTSGRMLIADAELTVAMFNLVPKLIYEYKELKNAQTLVQDLPPQTHAADS